MLLINKLSEQICVWSYHKVPSVCLSICSSVRLSVCLSEKNKKACFMFTFFCWILESWPQSTFLIEKRGEKWHREINTFINKRFFGYFFLLHSNFCWIVFNGHYYNPLIVLVWPESRQVLNESTAAQFQFDRNYN